jgi:hypothetical protein
LLAAIGIGHERSSSVRGQNTVHERTKRWHYHDEPATLSQRQTLQRLLPADEHDSISSLTRQEAECLIARNAGRGQPPTLPQKLYLKPRGLYQAGMNFGEAYDLIRQQKELD